MPKVTGQKSSMWKTDLRDTDTHLLVGFWRERVATTLGRRRTPCTPARWWHKFYWWWGYRL